MERIIAFAVEQGYTSASYIGKWKEFKCYEPIMNEEEVAYIGLPLLILEDEKGTLRLSTPEEAMQQLEDSFKHE